MTKNYFSIISKPYAYLQTMTKTAVNFQKNRHKTVGGVAHLKYLLLYGDRRMESHERQLSSKRRGTMTEKGKKSVIDKLNGFNR